MRSSRLLLAAGLAAFSFACSSAEDLGESNDALSTKALWADAKALDLSDLAGVVAKYASDGFNDAMSGDVGARVEVRAYGKNAEPNRALPNSTGVRGLEEIVSNLENRLGATELGTRLNKTRLATIESGLASHYIESSFKFRAGIGHDWSFGSKAVDGDITLGLDAGTELESRVVLATNEANLSSYANAPMVAAKNLRGFIAPRSFDEVAKMVPGESFTLSGTGKLATNLGLGVPVFMGGVGKVGYEVVVSAGVSALIQGQLDVQLMRLADEVVVDVGVNNVKSFAVRAAIEDRFGIKGICDDGDPCLREHLLGGKPNALNRLVERTVERKLRNHFQSRVGLSIEKESQRVGLTRIRFSLNRGNRAEVERALEQALKFDLRYAEALSNRDLDVAQPGVRLEFDALRSSTTSSFDFGVKLAGIDVYDRTVVQRTGTFVLQTPEGASVLSFDALEKSRKLFQTDHGIHRIAVGARSSDPRQPGVWRSEANLIVRTRYSDSHIHDDRFLDGIDSVISGLGGAEALASLDGAGSQLERAVNTACPVVTSVETGQAVAFDESCNLPLLGSPLFVGLKAQGQADLARHTQGLPPDLKALLTEAGKLRLNLQSVAVRGNAGTVDGVSMSLTLDQRFDDKALEILTSEKSASEYKKVLRNYLAAITVDRARLGEGTTREAQQAAVESKYGKGLESMNQAFAEGAGAYRQIIASERELLGELPANRFVPTPVGIRASETSELAREDGELASTSRERAEAIARLVDKLTKSSDRADLDLSLYDQHTATIPLLALVPAKNLKVGLSVASKGFDDDKLSSRERFRKAGFVDISASATGAEVAPITLGPFDLEAALTPKK